MGKYKTNNNGITLIALIITIIVLLILAGISIAMLTGRNGIITQGQRAKNQTENASKYEENRLNEYNDIINSKISGEEIEEQPIFDENTLTIGEARNSEKYGWKVSNYNVKTEQMSTDVWRLFFQDDNYTYLITDECIGEYKPKDYYESYKDGSYVSLIGKKLNPMLLESSDLFDSSNESSNMRTTAWLTDSEVWTEYKNDDAVFAIGSPTMELYCKSFNATSELNEANEITIDVGKRGYNYETEENQIEVDYNNGIYNKDDSSRWWIASPYGGNSDDGLNVYGRKGKIDDSNVEKNSYAVRPVVCILTSVFNAKYLSSLSNE